VQANQAAMAYLIEGFRRLGLDFVPSVTNFVLVRFRRDAREVARELERRGVIVRPTIPFGTSPEYARITTGEPSENEALLQALAEVAW
jgi:histidinol-phosphate aminotransferase